MSETTSQGNDSPVVRRGPYPYIIVRIYASVFQREPVAVRWGPPAAHVGYRKSFVQHPRPRGPNGLTPEARWLLIRATLEAVKRTGFRMCVVWGPESCSYCERDGSVNHSSDPPSGGIGGADGGQPMGAVLARAMGIDVTNVPRERLEVRYEFDAVPTAPRSDGQSPRPEGDVFYV